MNSKNPFSVPGKAEMIVMLTGQACLKDGVRAHRKFQAYCMPSKHLFLSLSASAFFFSPPRTLLCTFEIKSIWNNPKMTHSSLV